MYQQTVAGGSTNPGGTYVGGYVQPSSTFPWTYPYTPPPSNVCPGCGRCRRCGQSGAQPFPVGPIWVGYPQTFC